LPFRYIGGLDAVQVQHLGASPLKGYVYAVRLMGS